MAHSVNSTPLLQEFDSSDNDDEFTSIIDENVVDSTRDDDKISFIKPIAEPKDKYYVAYIIFYLLGMVTLLPWNFFITADDYWLYKFRDVNDTAVIVPELGKKRTPLQASFTSYISVASAVPNLIFLVLNTALTHKISLHKRVLGSLILMLILFTITLALVPINTDNWQDDFFLLTIVTIVLLNGCSAVLSGSIFGVLGRFCPLYITATLGGQALGGIFAAIAEIASLAIGASSTHSAIVYFVIGTITVAIAIASYAILTRTVFFQYYSHDKHHHHHHHGAGGGGAAATGGDILFLQSPAVYSYKTVLMKILGYGVSMMLVFIITLAVYPSVTVLIESQGKGHGNKWNDLYFVPTIAYLLFSIGDYLGRLLAGRIQKPKKGCILVILSLSRFIFIPLMMLCNAQPRHHWAVVFDRDYQYILILVLCALTNGYLANITAICAPRYVESHEKEIASSMMTVFMGVGLAVGSAISFFIVKLL